MNRPKRHRHERDSHYLRHNHIRHRDSRSPSRKRRQTRTDSRASRGSRKRKAEHPRQHNNTDPDSDSEGHFKPRYGDFINNRYLIIKQIGKGTFGKVFKCVDKKGGKSARYGEEVAVKVVRKVKKYTESAEIEADLLDDVRIKAPSEHFIALLNRFIFKGHYCIVTELLGSSLYDFLKKNEYQPFPLHIVSGVGQQLLQALAHLQEMNLIHTDLKCENVLASFEGTTYTENAHGQLVCVPSRVHIKVIDFGGATYDNEKKSTTINTRQYRSPEVILHAGWSFSSDLWSTACIIGELITGELLFSTHSNCEHLALMERMIGPFPPELLKSRRAEKYFDSTGCVRQDSLDRKSREYVSKATSLQGVLAACKAEHFLPLLSQLLKLNPRNRGTAAEALGLPFFVESGNGHSP